MAYKPLKLGGDVWRDDMHGWVDEILLGRKYKKPARAKKCVWTGVAINRSDPSAYPGKGSKGDIRGRLYGVARRSSQVMVKITGSAKGKAGIKGHMEYLSRDGELEMRDQDGRVIQGKEALDQTAWAWKYVAPMLDDKKRRESFNIVFSMPEGTDEKALYEAVKKTAEVEFEGHQWVMVQHFDEPHVHAHLCVKTESLDGHRLNPRKADLQRWRERFAYELRERGVEAEATRRATRVDREKINKPWEVTRLEERGLPTNPPPAAPNPARVEGWKKIADGAMSVYARLTARLRESSDIEDRQLGDELAARFGLERERSIDHINRDKDRS